MSKFSFHRADIVLGFYPRAADDDVVDLLDRLSWAKSDNDLRHVLERLSQQAATITEALCLVDVGEVDDDRYGED